MRDNGVVLRSRLKYLTTLMEYAGLSRTRLEESASILPDELSKWMVGIDLRESGGGALDFKQKPVPGRDESAENKQTYLGAVGVTNEFIIAIRKAARAAGKPIEDDEAQQIRDVLKTNGKHVYVLEALWEKLTAKGPGGPGSFS